MRASLAEQAWQVYRSADCLHDAAAIETALDRLAAAVTRDLGAANPLVLCPMTGAAMLAAGLLLRLEFPLEFDYLQVGRYRETLAGGELRWRIEPEKTLRDRSVLVVDDILDRGVTLAAVREYCHAAGAEAVRTLVLVDKECAREADIAAADYTGLRVPDRYVFGYGMDWHGYLRNLNGIYAVAEDS